MPAPSEPRSLSTQRLELALTEKQVMCVRPAKAESKAVKWRRRVAAL